MNTQANNRHGLLAVALLALPFVTAAQTPVDEDGNAVSAYMAAPDAMDVVRETGGEDIPLLQAAELEELVGPVALYPDDLLAIVLPASAYPMQIIDAQRFLEDLEDDPSLEPNPDWDDSVVALLNYPEVLALLNEDLDWTWRLGEAVVAQQADVVLAIESFRDRAYAAGNLKSDDYQNVSRSNGAIEISPVSDDVIYVPYYEPERVVVYQPRPVYYYYPRAYPVYYYPYPSSYHFDRGFFWGVTTAFTIGWVSDSLHVYHHSYYGHPYYGRSYRDRWWYRRPTINVYNTTYVRNRHVTVNHFYSGDRWRPRHDRRRPARPTQPRVMNRDHYHRDTRARRAPAIESREPVRFRDRSSRRPDVAERSHARPDRETVARQQRENRDRNTHRRDRVTRPTQEGIARQLRASRDRKAHQREEVSRPTQESVARQLRESRDRRVRNNPPALVTRERSQPAAGQDRNLRRDPVARQNRSQHSQPVTRVRNERAQQRPAVSHTQREAKQARPRSAANAEPRRNAAPRVERPQPQKAARQAPRRESGRSPTKENSPQQTASKAKRRNDNRRSAR
ncbi:MAG: DUF3300 domain-containing protein [Woeseiaceae bacterium]